METNFDATGKSRTPKLAVSFKVSPAAKVKIAEAAERSGQSVSEFCEMHILDACRRMLLEGEEGESGTLLEEIQSIFHDSFDAFQEEILEQLGTLDSTETNNEGDEETVLQSLTLPADLEEKLTTFLQEAAAYSEAADDEPLSEADVLHRLLAYALTNLAGKRAFFGKTYVGEVELL